MTSPEMGNTIDHKGEVKSHSISKNGCYEKGCAVRFSPIVPWDMGGKDDGKEKEERNIKPYFKYKINNKNSKA